MRTLLLRLEPVIWLLFGAGIMVGTILLPAYLLTIGLGGPLGLLPEGALAYDRVYAIASQNDPQRYRARHRHDPCDSTAVCADAGA